MKNKNMLLVLLAGQSNMAGRGIAGPDDLTDIPGLLAFGRDGKWHPAIEPVTRDRSFVGTFDANGSKMLSPDPWDNIMPDTGGFIRGVGPGRTFGICLLKDNPGRTVGLLPFAVGGTPIASWAPGGTDIVDRNYRCYDEAVRMGREAQKDGEIAAILWHQGEGDACHMTENYEEKLKQVILNFRRDLALGDDVPFLLGELAEFYGAQTNIMPGVPMVNGAMHHLAQTMPNVGVADAKGLHHVGDELHFDAASAHELGRRYYALYKKISGR